MIDIEDLYWEVNEQDGIFYSAGLHFLYAGPVRLYERQKEDPFTDDEYKIAKKVCKERNRDLTKILYSITIGGE